MHLKNGIRAIYYLSKRVLSASLNTLQTLLFNIFLPLETIKRKLSRKYRIFSKNTRTVHNFRMH